MMEKYDTSQLTEFPRFEAEATQSGVSTFFNKLWKLPLFTPSESGENAQIKGSEDEKQVEASTAEQSTKENESLKSEVSTYAHELEVRSLPNVLRRITSLIASGSGGGTKYSDTELARYWMPDDISRECYECAARFSTLRRRHHCRVCGQIFCSRCCSQRVPGHIFGCAGGLRVCNYCCNVVLSYLNENVDLNGEISPDLRSLQENLQVKFPDNKEQTSKSDNFMFGRDQEERSEVRTSSKETLQDVFRQLSYTLPTQQHRYRLVRYNGVWRGADILQWIMENTNNNTRVQANTICQNLLNSGYMECVTELPHFADYALYRPITVTRDDDDDDEEEPEECSRLVESVSSYCLDLNLGESSARMIKTPKTEKKSSSSEEEQPVIQPVEGGTEKAECKAMYTWGEEHLRLLMRQKLARAALPAAWLDALYPLCVQAADIIVPDPGSNDIDVRNYVQVKKVPGGCPKDSCLIRGVVLTKNVAHRGMPQQISNPSILLLDGSIAYQRVEGKLTSLEPVLMQEHEYLVRCAARITALRARVVLVGGTAGRAVQGALVRAGAALALRVRPRALRRAARATSADLLASIDARIGMPRLGTCDNFYVKSYGNKTLMVLEGCAQSQLSCCILLRGGSVQELIRLKKIVKFMLLACYNWKLEKAFLRDIEAVLPEPGMNFEEDENDDKEDDSESSKKSNVFDDKTTDVGSDITSKDFSGLFGSSSADNNDIFDSNNKDESDLSSKITDKYNGNQKPEFNDKDDAKNDKNYGKNDENDAKNVKIDANIDENGTIDDKIVSKNPELKSTNKNLLESDMKELDDPLQRLILGRTKSYTRKTDNSSCGVPIKDFSDPLRSNLSVDDDVFLPKEEAKLQADAQNDRWCADDVVLSMSPSVLIPAPYLETEAGRRCPLRSNFHSPLLRSPAASTPLPLTPRLHRKQTPMSPILPLRTQEFHPFVKMAISGPSDDPAQRAALANYRATGCRLNTQKHTPSCPQYNPSVVRKPSVGSPPEQTPADEALDPFAPENHQKLNVLLYSYSSKSPNVPDFCVNPWIVTMEMYGRHDISLGAFLEKYCFNADYKCNPTSCHIPMNQHVRRFVHGDVCITITCNTIGHSSVDKMKEDTTKQVMFWWRCDQCGWLGRGARLSGAALRVSLAQHVRARACPARTLRPPRAAPCRHALHSALHAFQCGLTTAYFRYSKVSMYDIVLPPDVITTNHDTKQMRDSLISQLNDIMLKGHETFSNVGSGEADKEYQAFKHHMDQIHVALTSPSLHHSSTDTVVRSLWSISDGIITGEKMLRDAQEKWSSPPAKTKPPPETNVEEKSDLDESSGEASNNESSGTTYVFASDNNIKEEKEHSGVEEDEEKGDKKTIRQILSQLLSSNQSANQAGMILCGGLVPVVVQATQTGSVIAAALASPAYRRARTHQRHSTNTEQEESDANKDKTDGDKSKAKSTEHVEVMLKDGLMCRVYYAAQFQALRHAVIAPLGKDHECCCDDDKKLCSIEEGFIRSLAHCVPWATRGGKSGSTFCKTKDDRYVLKEMTKPEWQQFLEFAPHYFNYVASCRQNKINSLLARILGVFSVGGAGDGVLVLEHVWYGCSQQSHTRFDLKGSSRHRLAPPAPNNAQPVLMDENLLIMRWERALFVRCHAARVLWARLERDTAFLAAHGVMDYSLLLALGDSSLVLGLIDYIRTFTWDKKLEHLVKKNLGSGQPTVVSPEQYKRRFINATRKYFLQCPEAWDQFYDVIQ